MPGASASRGAGADQTAPPRKQHASRLALVRQCWTQASRVRAVRSRGCAYNSGYACRTDPFPRVMQRSIFPSDGARRATEQVRRSPFPPVHFLEPRRRKKPWTVRMPPAPPYSGDRASLNERPATRTAAVRCRPCHLPRTTAFRRSSTTGRRATYRSKRRSGVINSPLSGSADQLH
jgi:hypothetical protein